MGTTLFARGARLLVAAFVCLFAAAPVLAETQKLSLSQVIDYSLQNNSDLKSFREEKGIRDAGKVKAGLMPNPALEMEGSTGALTGSNSENSLSIGVSQEILLAGKRGKRLTLAERELEMYRWQVADRERLIREEVKTAFYGVILDEQRLALADRSIALNRELLEVARERLAAGDIPELEMNLVKVELARSEGARIETERTLRQKLARIGTLSGLSTDELPAMTGTLDADPATPKALGELKQLARENRADLKALEAEKRRGEADIILARAEGVPDLTAALFYSHERRTDATGVGEEKVRDNLLGIRLSLPLPLFDRNQAGIQEARAKRSSTESRLLAVGRNVEREIETAYASYQNSEKVLALYKATIIPQLEENLKLTQEAYRLGEVGILSVIQEQKKFFEVSEGYLAAQHDRQTALVKLEAAVGVPLD